MGSELGEGRVPLRQRRKSPQTGDEAAKDDVKNHGGKIGSRPGIATQCSQQTERTGRKKPRNRCSDEEILKMGSVLAQDRDARRGNNTTSPNKCQEKTKLSH